MTNVRCTFVDARNHIARASALILIASACALLANCGGGSGDPTAPPTQPPVQPPVVGQPTVGTVPATITVTNGDGQTGEPGATLPVQPRVIVKDAAGLVVPSVSVTFSIDSGSGTLEHVTATTSTDGTASAGNWKLGATEGRNVILARVGALPAVKIAASARIESTTMPVQTIGSNGGTVTVSRPGSTIDGMTITFPTGSFGAPVDAQIAYQSSSSLPLAANVRAASPLITLTTSGPDAANAMFRVRIPVAISPDEFPVIAVVSPATGFLEALTTVDYDANSVTALGWALDNSIHTESSPASLAFRAWFPAKSLQRQLSKNLQMAVLFVEKTKIRNLVVETGFRPGTDDWEFDPEVTPIYNGSTSSGAVVTERYYFRNKKSINSGSLWKRFQDAPGAYGSNQAGLRWNKEITKEFEAQLPQHAGPAEIDRARNAVKYDSLVLQNIVVSFIASKGAPQIVAFKNLNTGKFTTVLAYKWDGPSGLLYDANPERPGDDTRKSTWNAKGFQCLQSCLAIIGINHIIGYQTKLDLQWPQVLDGTIDKDVVPQGYISSWGSIVGKTPSIGFDTLFVPDDTSRIWIECPTCVGQQPTQLPLKHGAAGLGTQIIYHEISRNSWRTSSVAQSNGFFFNVKQFPVANSNKWSDFNMGIEGRGFEKAGAPAALDAGGWIGWKTLRIIKFAPLLVYDKDAAVAVPVTFNLETEGGPNLPADATYEFRWGDGTTITRTPKPGALQHTYQKAGTFTVSLRVLHATGSLIAKWEGSIEVRAPSISFTLAGAWDPEKQPPNGTYNYPSVSDSRSSVSDPIGLDQIGFVYNLGSDETIGVFVAIQLPTGREIKTGDTFVKYQTGGPISGRFQFLLANDQQDPDAPDARQFVPEGTGTLRFDDVTRTSIGLWIVRYSFTITNGAGGTIVASGVAKWN